VWKKRPCSECRRWFRPQPRVGARQATCGAQECRRKRHRRADRLWHRRHPDYDCWRRLQAKVARAAERRRAQGVRGPPPLARVPWDLVQDEMGVKATEILAGILRLLVLHAQDEIRRQVPRLTGEFGRLPGVVVARRDRSGAPEVAECAHGPGAAPARSERVDGGEDPRRSGEGRF
jgi:hypothetical protein